VYGFIGIGWLSTSRRVEMKWSVDRRVWIIAEAKINEGVLELLVECVEVAVFINRVHFGRNHSKHNYNWLLHSTHQINHN
jgi:hypothetical protein